MTSEMRRNEARVAVVTGSSSGIGQAIVETLAERGWRVVVNSVSSVKEGEKVAAAIGPGAIYVQGDVSIKQDARTRIMLDLVRSPFKLNHVAARLPSASVARVRCAKAMSGSPRGTSRVARRVIRHVRDGRHTRSTPRDAERVLGR